MALALAVEGCPVVYSEPWFPQLHAAAPGAERQQQFVGLRELAPNLSLLRVPPWLLQEFVAESLPQCLVMAWPHQAGCILPESSSLVVYEMIDDHALMGRMESWWRRAHQRWVRQADVVAASADDLLAQLRPTRPDALLLPNAVRIEDWRRPAEPLPADMLEARKASLVVLYYGAIAAWFDWDLWLGAAAARPDWALVLVGFPLGIDDAEIRRRAGGRANVFYLGQKNYADLPAYLAHADVAAIPFKLNDVTHACSPIKLFEYMAAGKAVVATPMREILKYQSVLFADGPEAFVLRVEEAARKSADPRFLRALAAEAGRNTWSCRAQTLRDAVEAALRRQNGLPRRKLRPRPWSRTACNCSTG